MATEMRDTSSAFNRLAAVILAIVYRLLTLHQYMSYACYKLKHVVRFFVEGSSENFLRDLQSKPEHLALVFSESSISFADIAKLLSWCSEAEIKYVTLYEPKGALKTSVNQLLQAVEKIARNKFKVKVHFFSPNGYKEMATFNNVQNEVHVHLSAAEDGRGAIVEAARKLHQDQSGVTMRNVDNMLKVTRDWPEPDLLIRCGGINSHLGFLPWALRLTEFADLYSHHHLFRSEFCDILTSFSRTDRRCGR